MCLWKLNLIFQCKNLVVLSSDNVGVFCLPNSTESEKNFYVIRDRKALESVQNYRLVCDVITKGNVWGPSNGAFWGTCKFVFTIVNLRKHL